MGKRLVIGGILMAAALLLSISSYVLIGNSSERLIESAVNIIETEEKGGDSTQEFDNLMKLWSKYNRYYGIALKHTDADILDRYFIVLESTYESGNKESFTLLLKETIAFLQVTSEGEKLRAENIF